MHRIANSLVRSGAVPGDRVTILAKNCMEYPLFYYAAAKVGAVPVPLNYRLAEPEWAGILGDAAPTLVLVRKDLVSAVAPLRAELSGIENWVALDAAPEGRVRFEDWLADAPDSAPTHTANEADDLYQMYTSSTTGRPKGAVLTHAAVCSNGDQLNVIAQIGLGERCLIVAPMYHAAAAINVFNTVRHGGTVVIMEDFDPQAVVDALSLQRINATVLVPAMIQACLVTVADAAALSYDDLRYIGYGGSPIAAETLRHAIEVFGCDFGQGYGMTEMTAGDWSAAAGPPTGTRR